MPFYGDRKIQPSPLSLVYPMFRKVNPNYHGLSKPSADFQNNEVPSIHFWTIVTTVPLFVLSTFVNSTGFPDGQLSICFSGLTK